MKNRHFKIDRKLRRRLVGTLTVALLIGTLCGCAGGDTESSETQDGAGVEINDTQIGTETDVETDAVEATEEETEEEIAGSVWDDDDDEPAVELDKDLGDDPPEYPEIYSDEEVVKIGDLVVVGDTAYELYSYIDSLAEDYASCVNTVAANLSGKADVYDIVIPLSSGITFPDNLADQIDSTDQEAAISKISKKLNDDIIFLNIYDVLRTHRDEYIYFRTDHHWTALGAYYAYRQFCGKKGVSPEPIDSYETKEFDGFLGSFYTDTGGLDALGANPDVVTAYVPNMSATCHVTQTDGTLFDSPVIYNETNATADLKYSTFIAGDNPYTEIDNADLSDGSSCIVVKESFGNAFVPFLVDHYQTIYVIDYRYWTGSITDLAQETGADDVIFINNLSMTRNQSLIGKLYRVV
ncbi:MAG: hypothetical protein LUI02_06605 [Clostridiales bacterium]|nr:hypothetical protein [Clostridiales bacterium]